MSSRHLNPDICQQIQSINKEKEGKILFLHGLNVRFALVLHATFLVASSQEGYGKTKENTEKNDVVIEENQLLPYKQG